MKVWCIKYTLGRVNRFKSCWWNGNSDNWLDQFDNSYFDEKKVKAVIFEIVLMLFNISSLDELIDYISSKY